MRITTEFISFLLASFLLSEAKSKESTKNEKRGAVNLAITSKDGNNGNSSGANRVATYGGGGNSVHFNPGFNARSIGNADRGGAVISEPTVFGKIGIVGGRGSPVLQTVGLVRPISVPQPVPVSLGRTVPVAIPQPFPVTVPKPYPVAVPHPVHVSVPRPYPVSVPRLVPVPVPHPVPVAVPHPVGVPVPRPYPVPVPHPVPVPSSFPFDGSSGLGGLAPVYGNGYGNAHFGGSFLNTGNILPGPVRHNGIFLPPHGVLPGLTSPYHYGGDYNSISVESALFNGLGQHLLENVPQVPLKTDEKGNTNGDASNTHVNYETLSSLEASGGRPASSYPYVNNENRPPPASTPPPPTAPSPISPSDILSPQSPSTLTMPGGYQYSTNYKG